jgi:hypothetical protein
MKDRKISKADFHAILDKASQPISCQEKGETPESHLSDGCSGKCKSQDTIGDKEVKG